MSDSFSEEKFQEMDDISKKLAKARGQKVALESQRNAVRSSLMQEAEQKGGATSIQKQQRDAEADIRYFQVIDALKVAQEKETYYYLQFEIRKMQFEYWRTKESNHRAAMNLR
jgi:hypothetical protein